MNICPRCGEDSGFSNAHVNPMHCIDALKLQRDRYRAEVEHLRSLEETKVSKRKPSAGIDSMRT